MAELKRKYSQVPQDVERINTKFRKIITKLPVPESLPIFELFAKYEPDSMQGQPPVIVDRAKGFQVYDPYGNMWLDWSSGVLISNIGNGDETVCEALKEIINRPLLSTYVFPHENRAILSKMLCETIPYKDYKVFLLSTGSEATENCIKLAKTYGMERYGSSRKYIISFENAFHGRTMGAQLAGGMPKAKKWLGDLDPTFVQVPFPDGYRTKDISFDLFLATLKNKGINGHQVCGVMSESYQGVGPHFFPIPYAQALESWCKEHDVLLIMDEVQAGFCRTGKWYTFEHYGIQPDLIACGKGISGSLPLAAVLGRSDIMSLYGPGSMTSTHSGSPLPVAAAIANIEMLKKGPFMGNANYLGPILKAEIERLQKLYPDRIGHVSALGLVAGLQIVKPKTFEADADSALRLNEECFRRGLLMFAPVGAEGECIKIAPPLNITEEALQEGLEVFATVCKML